MPISQTTSDKTGGTVHPPVPARAGPVSHHRNGTDGSAGAVGSTDLWGGVKNHLDDNSTKHETNFNDRSTETVVNNRKQNQHFNGRCTDYFENSTKKAVRFNENCTNSATETEEVNNGDEGNYDRVEQDEDKVNEDCVVANIETVPSLVLTVFFKRIPVHITLDGGATTNYIRRDICEKLGIRIFPNGQVSLLGDRKTRLPSVGEIDETFTRDTWHVRFRALVVEELGADMFGGTVFQKDNDIATRIATNEITVKGKHRVFATDMRLPLPKAMQASVNLINNADSVIKLNSSEVIFPGSSLTVHVHPTEFCEGESVCIEPRDENKYRDWPMPQLCTVNESSITIKNTSSEPVIVGDDVHILGYSPVDIRLMPNREQSFGRKQHENYLSQQPVTNNINHIQINTEKIAKADMQRIQAINKRFKDVFQPSLTGGYNGSAGPHTVKLHWADSSRPPANKMMAPRWSTNRDEILQRKMDQLTSDGVLLVPHEIDTQVKFISNVFLQKKGRAAHKELSECSNDELRFLCDFTQLNSFLHPTPSKVGTPQEIWQFIAENPYIIISDMYNSYFQMHMDKRDYSYLGVMTPFKGLRIMSRSGQGLLNSDTELKELVGKVLGEEISKNICKVVADDLVIGGPTIHLAITNYSTVLSKLSASNIKLTPEKTRIFPNQATLHGWRLQDGLIEPDPHRKLALLKVQHEDIKTSSHLRAWIGLLKTFLPAMSTQCDLLDCLDKAVAGKEPKTAIDWTDEMKQNFSSIKKNASVDIKRLALPARNEQLYLLPDAAVKFPGIGFVLAVKRDEKFLPVFFMGFKLKQYHRLWYPCEQEALGVAVAVEKCSYFITQNKNRTIVGVDSKPVVEAYNLMKAGKFSSSSRMQSFLHCINRFPITIQHISGKFKANILADYVSRNPPKCSEPQKCQMCIFIEEKSTAILCNVNIDQSGQQDSLDIPVQNVTFQGYQVPSLLANVSLNDLIQGTADIPFGNRMAWKRLQLDDKQCANAIQHIKSSQPLPKKGSQHNDARNYFANASLSKPDDLLVVRTSVTHQSRPKERIVIPKPFVPAVVDQIHHSMSCPSEYQMNKIMDRYFYGINMRRAIMNTKLNCYSCRSRLTVPEKLVKFNPVSQPKHPGELFNADIIQRSAQNILVARDLFSCLTVTTIVPSQSAEDIKDGIVTIIQPVRKPGPVVVRMDNAPGNMSLKKFPHPELLKLDISIDLGDKLNKNSIASVDRAQQELEAELKKLSPEGQKITPAILALATQIINTKIRSQNLSALEIHLSREQMTGQNLQINDEDIAKLHFETKQKNNYYAQGKQNLQMEKNGQTNITVGDKVYINDDPANSKHTSRQMFLVTKVGDANNEVYIQKIIHSQSVNRVAKLSSELLRINVNRLYPASPPRPSYLTTKGQKPTNYDDVLSSKNDNKAMSTWSPFPPDYDSSDDEIDISREIEHEVAPEEVRNIVHDLLHDLRTPDTSSDSNDSMHDDQHNGDHSYDADDNDGPSGDEDGEDQNNDGVAGGDDVAQQHIDGGDDNGEDDEVEVNAVNVPNDLIGHTERRGAAVRAAQSIKRQAELYHRVKNDNKADIDQVDGCYITPTTSTDTSLVASGSRKKSETTDNLLDEDQNGSSLEWDPFHDQRENESLAEDVVINRACLPPPSLQLQFSHKHSHDLQRVYTYHGVLPIQPTPPTVLNEQVGNVDKDDADASEGEQPKRPKKKRKRLGTFWKKNKADQHDDRKDGDGSCHGRQHHEVRQ